jgi:glycosyltransferase involved in cell wall biosynthesis/ubiquinone/menaquinone biosynthesis C-methylase UbiE
MVRNLWDKVWEYEKDRIDIHSELIDVVSHWTKKIKGDRILEVGFGTGGDLTELAMGGFTCVGVEQSQVALSRAWNSLSLKKRRQKNISVNLALTKDGKIPLQDSSVDTVFHQGVMEHYGNPLPFLSEQRRVLKPGGIIVVDVPHLWNLYTIYRWVLMRLGRWFGGWERSYTANQLGRVLEKSGFSVIEIKYRGIWPHQWGKLLYPERIIKNQKMKIFLGTRSGRRLSNWLRHIYETVGTVHWLSSYNVIVVGKKRPLKVVIDARMAGVGGGIGRYIREIVNRFSNEDYMLVLVVNKRITKGNRRSWEFTGEKHNIVVIPEKMHWLVWEQIQLAKLLWREKPDLYHAPGNWGVPLLCPFPVVLTVHDVIPEFYPGYFDESKWPWLAKKLYHWRIQTGLRKATVVMCDSNSVKQDIRKYFSVDEGKLQVTALGVSDEYFRKKRPSDKRLLKKYRVRQPYIINHGGIDPRKNLRRLLEAFGQLVDNSGFPLRSSSFARQVSSNLRNYLQLVITGEGRIKKQLQAQAESLGIGKRVIWPGWVGEKEVAVLVRNAAVDVYPTLAEGFGLPLLEDKATGTPIAASNIPVLREIGGSYGSYFNPKSTSQMVETMRRLLKKKRTGHRSSLSPGFSWDRVVREVAEVYRQTGSP